MNSVRAVDGSKIDFIRRLTEHTFHVSQLGDLQQDEVVDALEDRGERDSLCKAIFQEVDT